MSEILCVWRVCCQELSYWN